MSTSDATTTWLVVASKEIDFISIVKGIPVVIKSTESMNSDMQDKENKPFLIARRPARPRKIRRVIAEENWRSIPMGPGQDVDDEVFSLCNKFSTTSIRGSESAHEQYTFKNIDKFDGNLLESRDESLSVELQQITPHCTPRESPSGRITPRKPLHPLKSATKSDPSIKGVIFTMRSGIKRSVSLEEFTPDVFIDSIFTTCSSSKKRPKSQPFSDSKLPIKRNGRRRNCKTPVRLFSSRCSSWSSASEPFCSEDSGDSLSFSSSPSCEDFLGVVPISVEKECASCGTNKTPLWRDAEDGTHLCNACGIRWKKYRVRCIRCWYIPKKEEKLTKTCPSCSTSGSVKMALPKAVKKN